MQEELAAYTENTTAKALIFALARAGELDIAKQLIDQNDSEIATAVAIAEQGKADQYAYASV